MTLLPDEIVEGHTAMMPEDDFATDESDPGGPYGDDSGSPVESGELSPDELEAAIEKELEAEDGEGKEERKAGFDDNVVRFGGKAFEIGEPDLGVTLRILNAIGRIGVRGERVAARLIKNPSSRAVVFGMLAALQEDDLRGLAIALLQLEDTKENRRWLREARMQVAPLVKAFFLNYSQSEDLREALANFFVGQEMLEMSLADLGV
jgi:hypothetical protein